MGTTSLGKGNNALDLLEIRPYPAGQGGTKVPLTPKFLPYLLNELRNIDWQKLLGICQGFLPIPKIQRICNGSGDATDTAVSSPGLQEPAFWKGIKRLPIPM